MFLSLKGLEEDQFPKSFWGTSTGHGVRLLDVGNVEWTSTKTSADRIIY